jgi:NADH-quinone oxidoreductase subunit L
MSATAQAVVAWVGGITALLAATIAVGQYDIKKVLAYSTISQLGFMVAAVGMGAFAAGMFHLVTHAFFKALLFLSAGSVIQGLERGAHHVAAGHVKGAHSRDEAHPYDPQDMRTMGGLRDRMPLTFWVYLIGALALSGIAPLAGFFSKDEILAEAYHLQPGVFYLLIIAAFFTAFYMGRQVLMVFYGKSRSKEASAASESPAVMTVPLVALALLSVVGGALNLPAFLGEKTLTQQLTGWLDQTLQTPLRVFGNLRATPETFNIAVALSSLGLALLGLVAAWWVYGKLQPLGKGLVDPLSRSLGPLFTAFEKRWWVDELYGVIIVRPFHALTGFLAQPVDLGVINAAGDGLGRAVVWISGGLRRIQNGFVSSYALAFLLGVIILMSYLIFR